MDWRKWAFEKLTVGFPELSDLVQISSVYSGASLTSSPATRPFIVLTLGEEVPTVADATNAELNVFVHDDPGSYDRIREILQLVKPRLVGQVSDPGGVSCAWLRNSADLADDTYGTVMRYATFQLVGRG